MAPQRPTSLIWNYFNRETKDLSKSKGCKQQLLFSEGGNVVTPKRTSLEPGKVKSIVVINKNKSLLNAYKNKLAK